MSIDQIEIRRTIHNAGFGFRDQMDALNKDLGNVAGEFMSLNEEYVWNHLGWQKTRKTLDILHTGYTENQKLFLERVSEAV